MTNTVAKVFRILSFCIFGLGFIAGFIIGTKNDTLVWGVTFYVWIICFVQGMIFIAISEGISLAYDRNKYLKYISLEIAKKNGSDTSEISAIDKSSSQVGSSYSHYDVKDKMNNNSLWI